MATYINTNHRAFRTVLAIGLFLLISGTGYGQQDSSKAVKTKSDTSVQEETVQPTSSGKKPVKNTFESIWLIDNQSVIVPIKKTFELDFQHRFGTWDNGYQDLFGLFGGINMRIGFDYVPIDNLMVGFAFTEYNLTWETYAKYAILKQTRDGSMPVSLTYYGNIAIDTKEDPAGTLYPYWSDRWMFFNQLIIARKISEKISVQVAPSITHVNSVQGYLTGDTASDGTKIVGQLMNHNHFAIAFSGKWTLKEGLNILLNYDQPLTKHKTNNPAPNLSAALEITTSAHTFQVTIGNYRYITPSRNNYYNTNDPTGPHGISTFLLGFNMTRLWNY